MSRSCLLQILCSCSSHCLEGIPLDLSVAFSLTLFKSQFRGRAQWGVSGPSHLKSCPFYPFYVFLFTFSVSPITSWNALICLLFIICLVPVEVKFQESRDLMHLVHLSPLSKNAFIPSRYPVNTASKEWMTEQWLYYESDTALIGIEPTASRRQHLT